MLKRPEASFYSIVEALKWLRENFLPISYPGLTEFIKKIFGIKKKELSGEELDKIRIVIVLRGLNFGREEIQKFIRRVEWIRQIRKRGSKADAVTLSNLQDAISTYKDIISRSQKLKTNINYLCNDFLKDVKSLVSEIETVQKKIIEK